MTTANRLLNPAARKPLGRAAEWTAMVTVVVLAVPLVFGTIVMLAVIYAAMLAVVLMQRPQFWVGVLLAVIVAKLVGWI